MKIEDIEDIEKDPYKDRYGETIKESGISVDIGGLWESSSWEILFDVKLQDDDITPCPHCYGRKEEKVVNPPRDYTETTYRCPRVIVVKNEGGFNTTGLCLDCVIEANIKMEELKL